MNSVRRSALYGMRYKAHGTGCRRTMEPRTGCPSRAYAKHDEHDKICASLVTWQAHAARSERVAYQAAMILRYARCLPVRGRAGPEWEAESNVGETTTVLPVVRKPGGRAGAFLRHVRRRAHHIFLFLLRVGIWAAGRSARHGCARRRGERISGPADTSDSHISVESLGFAGLRCRG